MTYEGADPDQLEALGKELRGHSAHLRTAGSTVSGRVRSSSWRGPAADRFRHGWEANLARQLQSAADALDAAGARLAAEADQQRVASGEHAHGSSGLSVSGVRHEVSQVLGAARGRLGGVEHALGGVKHHVGEVASAAAAGVSSLAARAGHDLHEGWEIEKAGFHETVSSQAFAETMGGLRVVQTVAGVAALLPVPVVQEAAAVVLAASSALLFVGDAAQMANSGHWEPFTLVADGLSAASGVAELRAVDALRVAQMERPAEVLADSVPMRELLTTDLSRLPEAVGGLREEVRTVATLKLASTVASTAQTSLSIGQDLGQGHYADAARDAAGYLPTLLTVSGDAPPELGDVLDTEVHAVEGGLAGLGSDGPGPVETILDGFDR